MASVRPKTQAALPWLVGVGGREKNGLRSGGGVRGGGFRKTGKGKEGEEVEYPTLFIKTLEQPDFQRSKSTEFRTLKKQLSSDSVIPDRRIGHMYTIHTPVDLTLKSQQSLLNMTETLEREQQTLCYNGYQSYVDIMKNRHRSLIRRQLKRGPSKIFQKGHESVPVTDIVLTTSAAMGKRVNSAKQLSRTLAYTRKKLALGFTRYSDTFKPEEKSLCSSPQLLKLKHSAMMAEGMKVRLRPKRGLLYRHFF